MKIRTQPELDDEAVKENPIHHSMRKAIDFCCGIAKPWIGGLVSQHVTDKEPPILALPTHLPSQWIASLHSRYPFIP
jgi:hypothetical protein